MISNSIAGFFLSEMEGWQDSIEFYVKEMLRFDELFRVIIRMNTVPHLAEKVEQYSERFRIIQKEMQVLEEQITAGESDLVEDDEPLSNDDVSEQVSNRQKDLRSQMHVLQNRFLELKYECDSFIADTLLVQNKS